jgi:hypothetical protein
MYATKPGVYINIWLIHAVNALLPAVYSWPGNFDLIVIHTTHGTNIGVHCIIIAVIMKLFTHN